MKITDVKIIEYYGTVSQRTIEIINKICKGLHGKGKRLYFKIYRRVAEITLDEMNYITKEYNDLYYNNINIQDTLLQLGNDIYEIIENR